MTGNSSWEWQPPRALHQHRVTAPWARALPSALQEAAALTAGPVVQLYSTTATHRHSGGAAGMGVGVGARRPVSAAAGGDAPSPVVAAEHGMAPSLAAAAVAGTPTHVTLELTSQASLPVEDEELDDGLQSDAEAELELASELDMVL